MAGSPVPSSAASPRSTHNTVVRGRGTRRKAAYADAPGELSSTCSQCCSRSRMAASQTTRVSGPQLSSWPAWSGRQSPRMR
eukprot:1993878-Pleurochrysis_carterae.AAC.1